MTNQEREELCQLLACLFYPPDEDLSGLIHQGKLHGIFEKYVRNLGGDATILRGFLIEGTLATLRIDLRAEYDRLFSGLEKDGVALVESCYKMWTKDRSCSLPFASETGLLMGDSAVHLLEIYQMCDLEVAEEFKGCPDHLALELEFLSYLYRWTTDGEIKRFIEDHLDWIPLLRERSRLFDPHPFYWSAIEILDLLLRRERERLEVEDNGKKRVY